MNLIDKFGYIAKEVKAELHKMQFTPFGVSEEINSDTGKEKNLLAHGDNLEFMKYLLYDKNMAGKINMIYIDPPFFTKAAYDAVIQFAPVEGKKLPPVKHPAYEDIWQRDMEEYLKMLTSRLCLMKELLADDGTIWVHLDWHVVHYVKIFMDEIFGEENFVNEIIWHYKSGGSGKRHFARKHDTILVYSKTKKYYFAPPKEKSYNRGFKPYRFKGVKEYKYELGWYTMVTMKDVWNVDMVGRTSSERTGYATQKPEALLERIIDGATREGDLCADFFCGSGTMAAAAEKKGRKWICCDDSPLAVSSVVKRTQPMGAAICVFEQASGDKHGTACEAADKIGADICITREEVAGSDKELLRVTLKNYIPEKTPEAADAKGTETLKTIMEKDPLQLVEYWSVDFDYDGRVYRPQAILSKNKGRPECFCEKLISAGKNQAVCVKTVDVLGNCTMQTFKLT